MIEKKNCRQQNLNFLNYNQRLRLKILIMSKLGFCYARLLHIFLIFARNRYISVMFRFRSKIFSNCCRISAIDGRSFASVCQHDCINSYLQKFCILIIFSHYYISIGHSNSGCDSRFPVSKYSNMSSC